MVAVHVRASDLARARSVMKQYEHEE